MSAPLTPGFNQIRAGSVFLPLNPARPEPLKILLHTGPSLGNTPRQLTLFSSSPSSYRRSLAVGYNQPCSAAQLIPVDRICSSISVFSFSAPHEFFSLRDPKSHLLEAEGPKQIPKPSRRPCTLFSLSSRSSCYINPCPLSPDGTGHLLLNKPAPFDDRSSFLHPHLAIPPV